MPFLKWANKQTICTNQKGSVLTSLLAGIALVGTMGVIAFNVLSGPVATMSDVTHVNKANDRMQTASRVALAAALQGADGGDCDDDQYIEPPVFEDTAQPKPTNGGFLPINLGIQSIDQWGTSFGYCSWDMGPITADAACGGAAADRLDGADDPANVPANRQHVIAVISAGKDRLFDTICKNEANAALDGTGTIVNNGDDIIHSYSYNGATQAVSGLWSLKEDDAGIATLDKTIEIDTGGGIGAFDAINTAGRVHAGGGVQLPTQATLTTCNIDNVGLLRVDTTIPEVQICKDQGGGTYGWDSLATGGGGSTLWSDTAIQAYFQSTHMYDTAGGALPLSGSGTQFTWHLTKRSLRAGSTGGSEWDDGNIGLNSTAFGRSNIASGQNSFSAGRTNTAAGENSAAFGINSQALGDNNVAIGVAAITNGDNSIAIGEEVQATGEKSIALGMDARVSGDNSIIIGIGDHPSSYREVTANNVMAMIGNEIDFGIGRTDPTQSLDIDGSIRLADETDPCGANNEGTLRFNTNLNRLELCNDDGWSEVASQQQISALRPTPAFHYSYSITASALPATSDSQSFTLTNLGSADTGNLTVSLSNTQYFEKLSDTCDGNNITAGSSCSISVRATSAQSDGTFSGTIMVTDNAGITGTVIPLRVTVQSNCPVGTAQAGGIIASCKGPHYLIATPGGCNNSSTPTCSGTDYVTKTFYVSATPTFSGANSTTDGVSNTATIIATGEDYYAAQFCDNMTYGGYSDWYLPASDEVLDLFYNQDEIGGFNAACYHTSTQANATAHRCINMETGTTNYPNSNNSQQLRCVRRDTVTPPPISTSTFDEGYFVLSADTHDGNFDRKSGADAWCLSQLTTYNWTGKTTANSEGLLTDKHVEAFLCYGNTSAPECAHLRSGRTYNFATANDLTAGGAQMTTTQDVASDLGLAPHDAQAWGQTTYFNFASETIWANHGHNSATELAPITDVAHCDNWSTNDVGSNGGIGTISTSAADQTRWGGTGGSTQTCDQSHRVICMVHPAR